MNFPHDAVPVLRSAFLAVSIELHSFNLDVVETVLEHSHRDLRTRGLVSINLDIQLSKSALRTCIGLLGVFAKREKLAESSGERTACIVLGGEN